MKQSPYRREKKALNAEMNVVPYIDVMLVLLVIFMVTAPMLITGVDVDLPKEQTNTMSQSQLPVIVSLTGSGEIFISYENNIDLPISSPTPLLKLLPLLPLRSRKSVRSEISLVLSSRKLSRSAPPKRKTGNKALNMKKSGTKRIPPRRLFTAGSRRQLNLLIRSSRTLASRRSLMRRRLAILTKP